MAHRLLAVVALALVGPGVSAALDRPIAGTKLVLARTAAGREKLVFVSRDPNLLFPAIGSADDPSGTPGGATIDLFSTGEPSGATLAVPPPPGWVVRPSTTSVYRFRAAADASTAVRSVTIKQGRLLKIVARRVGLGLAIPQGAVGIRITTGAVRNCALFGAGAVRKDVANAFVASKAAAPAGDCSDVALGGTTTTTTSTTSTTMATVTTTSTTIPGVCGDGMINQTSEDCDGADAGFCTMVGASCRPPGYPGECKCCFDGGPGTGITGCCDPYDIFIPAPDTSGTCIKSDCHPPFTCGAGAECRPDYSCCELGGSTCLANDPVQPYALPCCAGLVCRGATPFYAYALSCCVDDGGACTADGDCCTGHCTTGVCDACRPGGASCTSPYECCTIVCDNTGTCSSCLAAGANCFADSNCCSGSCSSYVCAP